MKLTPTQIKVLSDLAEGGTLHFMAGLHASFFVSNGNKPHYGVRWDTANKLIGTNLVDGGGRSSAANGRFHITDAGREALRLAKATNSDQLQRLRV